MLNEIEEFEAYTGEVSYTSTGKKDKTYLGRFIFSSLRGFEGLSRVLTIVVRGYMYKNGAEPQIDIAREALQAWCSIPDSKKASPKEDWQFKTDFRDLHGKFPELVDENGCGWYYRHVWNVIRFIQNNPDKVVKTEFDNVEGMANGFDNKWRKKVMQFQIPLYSLNTKAASIFLFENALADALELGELMNNEVDFTPAEKEQITAAATKEKVPAEVLSMIIAYYRVNKQPDSDWVVLPVTNFDAYFGNTSFGRKWLKLMPKNMIERQDRYGVCRYRVVGNIKTDIC